MIRSGRLVAVSDSSQVSEARRVAVQCANELRMSENGAGRVALLATELATNLVKHAGGGSIIVGLDAEEERTLTLISIDKGQGIANLRAAMQDGYSTAGSPGTGLGAIDRKSDSFDVFSTGGKGTVVMCRVIDGGLEGAQPAALAAMSRMRIGGICLAKSGEEESGDAWGAVRSRDGATIVVADGLGHGEAAATASIAAIRVFREHPDLPLEQLMERMHGALRPTRGAAVGIARIHLQKGNVDFIGVGNIACTIVSETSARKTISQNGIVGHEARRLQGFSYPWMAASVLIMQSDGLSSTWNGDHYPGLFEHEPSVIAAAIYRDHCRGSDDATVVVAKAS